MLFKKCLKISVLSHLFPILSIIILFTPLLTAKTNNVWRQSIDQKEMRHSLLGGVDSIETDSASIDSVLRDNADTYTVDIPQDTIQDKPSNLQYYIGLARKYYDIEEYQKSLGILDSIESSFNNFTSCRVNLLRSKILFDLNRDNEGLNYFWQATHSLQDSADSQEIFSDLRYIMNNNEYDEFQTTEISLLNKFYERFWRSRDPNLTSDQNERIPEYYRRLSYARKNYSRSTSGKSDKTSFYQFEHPIKVFRVKMGDVLLNPLVPKALSKERDLDDLGLIYVRHGKPDRWWTYNCVGCTQNLTWFYYKNYYRSEMVFHFVRHGGKRGWIMESVPSYFQNRWELGYPYTILDPTAADNLNIADQLRYFRNLEKDDIEYTKVGVETETSNYLYEAGLLNLPVQFLSFKGEQGETNMELYYGLDGRLIELDTIDKKLALNLSNFIGFYDDSWNEVVKIKENDKIIIAQSKEEWKNSVAIRLQRFSVLPDTYNYEIHILDNVTANRGLYKGIYTVQNYYENQLAMSDILLSDPIKKTEQRSPFKKGDLLYRPHMFSPFKSESTLGLYFEVYNLLYDDNDRTDFQITWTLQESETSDEDSFADKIIGFFGNIFAGEKKVVKSTLAYSGNKRDDQIYINLELQDSDPGNYEMIIHVKDINSDTEINKKVKFTII